MLRRLLQGCTRCRLVAPSLLAQALHHREDREPRCPAIDVRLTAKLPSGIGYRTLTAADLRVSFPNAPGQVLALNTFVDPKDPNAVTDILFVVSHFSSFTGTGDLQDIISTLARHETFRFRAAVLGPEGTLSPFSADLKQLQAALAQAAKRKPHGTYDISTWQAMQQKAFLQLRHLDGRHVIVLFSVPPSPIPNHTKNAFTADFSMDQFAQFDFAQIYHLLNPPTVSASIPGGDASTEHAMDTQDPDALAFGQGSQLQQAIALQDATWATQHFWNTRTAGRAETTLPALLTDLIDDTASTYNLLVQPMFDCSGTGFFPVTFSSLVPHVTLFGPSTTQMIPSKLQLKAPSH